MGDPRLPRVVGHHDRVPEGGDLARQAHPGRDDQVDEGVGAVAGHGADLEGVEVVDALGGEADVEVDLPRHEGGGVAEGRGPVEEGDDRGILPLDLLEVCHGVGRPHPATLARTYPGDYLHMESPLSGWGRPVVTTGGIDE